MTTFNRIPQTVIGGVAPIVKPGVIADGILKIRYTDSSGVTHLVRELTDVPAYAASTVQIDFGDGVWLKMGRPKNAPKEIDPNVIVIGHSKFQLDGEYRLSYGIRPEKMNISQCIPLRGDNLLPTLKNLRDRSMAAFFVEGFGYFYKGQIDAALVEHGLLYKVDRKEGDVITVNVDHQVKGIFTWIRIYQDVNGNQNEITTNPGLQRLLGNGYAEVLRKSIGCVPSWSAKDNTGNVGFFCRQIIDSHKFVEALQSCNVNVEVYNEHDPVEHVGRTKKVSPANVADTSGGTDASKAESLSTQQSAGRIDYNPSNVKRHDDVHHATVAPVAKVVTFADAVKAMIVNFPDLSPSEQVKLAKQAMIS